MRIKSCYLTTGQVASRLRVSVSTLKRWLEVHDLAIAEKRNANGWRLFSELDVERLRQLKRELRKKGRRFSEATLLPVESLEKKDGPSK
ncbi:MerR family transcriptional regulator [Chitinispirillales bacterium ANBcel5]|uniref:MerR family transcriptional regulator n=1 Tax=Cellulosispirillum alkaliphilum TaxID=3039283 RepID=UPI002A58975D|nr:MerR family transcriptional regulator [Chitinispirillales bacterium ANBcel5]